MDTKLQLKEYPFSNVQSPLNELANEFYEATRLKSGSQGSVDQYRRILSRLIFFLKKKDITDWKNVTADHLFEYQKYLSKLVTDNKNKKIWSHSTQLQHWACIRGLFSFLKDIKKIDNESARNVFKDLTTRDPPRHDHLTPEEMTKLWNFCSDNPLYLGVISTLFFTGIRHSELINMNVNSVSFEEKTITVRGKGDKVRTIYMIPELEDNISKYLAWRELPEDKVENPLFLHRGKRISYNRLSVMFKELKKCIPRIYPHLLRHTFATDLMEVGANIIEVQKKLGHKDVRTTQRYIDETSQSKETHKKLAKYYRRNEDGK